MTAAHVAIDGSATRSKRPAAYPAGVGGYAAGSDGPYLVTADGRRLLDWVCGLGATPLGASHPVIRAAVRDQLEQGGLFSFPHMLEEQIAALFCERVAPWAQQVKFVKTGSEACAGAVRIARAATGRTMVVCVKGHYHGWHDWHAATADEHPGVPSHPDILVSESHTLIDTLDYVSRVVDIAAVILEPATRDWIPDPSWLSLLKERCHAVGALLILDEMICGGRLALGGGSEYFGVTPDLATYGKALGGGVPFACIAGSAELMRHSAYVSGTYSGDALGLAACGAVLDVYQNEPVIESMRMAGQAMRLTLEESPVVECVTGPGPFLAFRFRDEHDASMSRCVQVAAEHGVLFHPQIIFAPALLTSNMVQQSCDAMWAGLVAVEAGERCEPSECYAGAMRS